VLLKAHWLLVVVNTGKDWMQPIVKLFIVYYVGHFYSSINITMSATTYITIDSRKRKRYSGNTCDAVYFLDRMLQGVQVLRLSNMQFYNTIYNITQYNNTIAFTVTSSGTTTSLAPGNYVVSEFTAALQTLMNGALSGFTVTYSNITGLITIANSNSFLLNFTTSTMYVVLGFLPQQYAATTSITAPYALNLLLPEYISLNGSKYCMILEATRPY